MLDAGGARESRGGVQKCPKSGRDRDAQGVWKHRFAEVLLANDDFDGAIEIVVAMQDCRISGHGPGPLASRSRSVSTRIPAVDRCAHERTARCRRQQ